VAAALLALNREEPAVAAPPSGAAAGAPAAWVKVFVGVGRRDGAAAKDLVGAMTRELGMAKSDIGRVEVRESFSLVEVTPQHSASVIKGLGRVTIRGRRVTAKLDQRG
jgi:ATP-dependent RNA helicase DeaD